MPPDVAFKRRMDPYDLMNPGKMSFGPEEDEESEERGSGAQLPSEGVDVPCRRRGAAGFLTRR